MCVGESAKEIHQSKEEAKLPAVVYKRDATLPAPLPVIVAAALLPARRYVVALLCSLSSVDLIY